MPIQLPVLDDRSYRDFLKEARPLYAQFSRNWTNHNPSDPGVTLTELFAVLSEAALYRLDRVTPAMRRQMASLCAPPPRTARVDLVFTFTDMNQFQNSFTLFFPKNLWFSADGRRYAVARDTTFRWPEDAGYFKTERNGIDYTSVSLRLPVYNFAEYDDEKAEVVIVGYDGTPARTDGSANQEIPMTFLSGKPLVYSAEMFDPGNTYRWGPPKLVLKCGAEQTEWEFKADLLQSTPTDRHFTIDYHWGAIRFGDGVKGGIPSTGCTLHLSGIKISDGREGSVGAARTWNIPDEGQLNELDWKGEEKVKDGLANGALLLANPGRSTEGEDWSPMQNDTDRLAFLEDRATRFRRKRCRAVTRDDFEDLGKKAHEDVGRVAAVANFNGDVSAGGERVEENAVTLFTVLKNGAASSKEEVITAVREFVRSRCLVTTRVYAATMSVDKLRLRLRIAFESTIAGDTAFNRMRETVRAAVERYFDPVRGGLDGKGLTPGEPLNRAELYTLVERIEGVDFVEEITVSVLASGGSRFGIPVLVPQNDDAESVEIVRVVH